MHRTQIYLPDDLTEALDRVARERGTSRATIIREAAARYVAAEPEPPYAQPGEDPLDEWVGMFESGIGDLAENHDRHLVDSEIERWRA